MSPAYPEEAEAQQERPDDGCEEATATAGQEGFSEAKESPGVADDDRARVQDEELSEATEASLVMDYDRPPRPIKMTQPVYPQRAFEEEIQGTVLLEIWIDTRGRVVRARVIDSIPELDAAAIATVKQWCFEPALKDGRPVMTMARAPITFRIDRRSQEAA